MKSKKTYNVFVVEDSDAYRSLEMRVLEHDHSLQELNFSINYYGFPSGEECLENMDLNPDIIILDYHLNSNGYEKNMSGLKLIKQIRGNYPDTNTIILSCQKNVEVVKELMQEGVKEYIKKDSVALHRVKELVRTLIESKEKQLLYKDN